MLGLHGFGVVPGRHLRIVAELHVLAGLVLALMTAFPRRTDPRARFLLTGLGILFLTAIPDLLTGLGLLDVNVLPWGVVLFVLCMGQVLYQHYGAKEQELETRVREMETLNAELRHQIAERSRDLARNPSGGGHAALPQLGTIVGGRYEILRALGAGAMGQVFEVVRTSDGARFALKVMLGQTGQDVVRFAREAEIAARLAHANLVCVIDVGVGSWGSPFIVMELVHGGALVDRKLEGDAIGATLASVARGLAELHAHGVVHRDLKPSNVLVSERDGRMEVKLADFGIARALPSGIDATQRASERVTKEGAFLGTPLYMAPEQAVGADRVTPAADMFAFGVMAYELWTGTLPFPSPVVFLALAQLPLPEPPSFDACVLDPQLRKLLRSCLLAAPAERPSAQRLADALSAVYEQEGDGQARRGA
jgi:serine/threonine-protein kinase